MVSCAGQKKWTKPDFRQEEFEKDRKECLRISSKFYLAVESDPQASLKLEECLAKKGYESEPSPNKEESKADKIAEKIEKILVYVVGYVFADGLAWWPSFNLGSIRFK
jgi:hypothetical protein